MLEQLPLVVHVLYPDFEVLTCGATGDAEEEPGAVVGGGEVGTSGHDNAVGIASAARYVVEGAGAEFAGEGVHAQRVM